MCYVHNVSPHKDIIWNNSSITVGNKSIYRESWIERDIIFVTALFDDKNHLTVIHLFCHCPTTSVFWSDIEKFVYNKTGHSITIKLKDIIKPLSFMTNLIIVIGKFHIHKARFSRSLPNFSVFLVEFNMYMDTLTLTTNKKGERTLSYF